MRSVSASGPIGWAHPSTMPASMSSAVAKPDSSMRIADSRYGMSRALTTKPARSCERITCLPSASANPAARSAVRSAVSSELTSSTSLSTGTGLKKWMPITCSGRPVAMPSFMIGMDDVFDARMAAGSSTTLSRAVKTCFFASSSSMMASTTTSRSASSPRSVTKRRRPCAAAISSSVSLPARRPRANEPSILRRPASARAWSTSWTTTSNPDRAVISAMPDPISPHPTTPTRSVTTTFIGAAPGFPAQFWLVGNQRLVERAWSAGGALPGEQPAEVDQLPARSPEHQLELLGQQEVAVQRVVAVDADAPVQVLGGVDDPLPAGGGPVLGDRHLAVRREARREPPGGLQHREPDGVGVDIGVRSPLAHGLERGDGPAELLARRRVLAVHPDGLRGEPRHHRTGGDRGVLDGPAQDGPAGVDRSQRGVATQPHAGQDQLRLGRPRRRRLALA